MARAYQKYEKVFEAKGFDHPDVNFVTDKGREISLRWNKSEYRTFRKESDGHYSEMFLGGTLADNLKSYITSRF